MIDVYASLEIQKNEMYFVVSRAKNEKVSIIYKDKIKGEWLDDEDVVIDTNIASSKLNRRIEKFEKEFNMRLKYLILILPSGTLRISNADTNIKLNPTVPINEETLKEVYTAFNNGYKLRNYENISIRPYSFKISNSNHTNEPPIGMKSEYLLTEAKIYSVISEVNKSHIEVVNKVGKEVILRTIDMFAMGKEIVGSKKFKNTFVLVNWGKKNVKIGFYSQEALGDLEVIHKGTDDLIESIARKLNIKPRDAEKYMFKLIDFSKQSFVNSDLVLRKYDAQNFICKSYTSHDIKKIIIIEIEKFLIEIQRAIKNTIRINPEVYYFGKITNIAGFADIIAETEFSKTSRIFYSNVLASNELWVTTSLGSVAIQRLLNKQNPNGHANSLEVVKIHINYEVTREVTTNQNMNKTQPTLPQNWQNLNRLQENNRVFSNKGYNTLVQENNYNYNQANHYPQQVQMNVIPNQLNQNYINQNQNVQNYRDNHPIIGLHPNNSNQNIQSNFQNNQFNQQNHQIYQQFDFPLRNSNQKQQFNQQNHQFNQQNSNVYEQSQYFNYKNNNNF